MSQPFLSIIVAIYNVSEYLPTCLESILNQTYQSFEVVLVNDGSTDESELISKEYANRDTRIKLISQANQGLFGARNTGIDNSSGEYLYFIDGDDWLEPNLVERVHDEYVKRRVECFLFGHTKELVLSQGFSSKMPVVPFSCSLQSNEELVDQMPWLMGNGCGFAVWEQFFNSQVIRNFDLRFPPFKRGADIYFIFSFYSKAKSLTAIPVPLYHYNAFNSQNKFNPNLIENHVSLFNKYMEVFQSERKLTSYTVQLFTLWFAHVIPTNIVNNKLLTYKEKISYLKQLTSHPKVVAYLSAFNGVKPNGFIFKALSLILQINNIQLLFWTTQLKIWFKMNFKLNYKKWAQQR